MKALIDGGRIAQVADEEFPVAPPLQWVTVGAGVTAEWTYVDGTAVPRPSPALADIKTERARYLNVRRDAAIASGVEFEGATYDTDKQSIDNLTAAVAFIQAAPAFGLATPATISWRDADNLDHDLTPAQLVQLGAVIFQQVQTAHFTARVLKDSVKAAKTAAAVNAIDWS